MLTGCGGFRELPRTPGSGRATLPPTRFDRAGQVVVPRAVDAVHVPAQVAVRPPLASEERDLEAVRVWRTGRRCAGDRGPRDPGAAVVGGAGDEEGFVHGRRA